MADTLMTAEQVAGQLQISKDEVIALVKKGLLRGFMDQKTYKFRSADVENYRRRFEAGATSVKESGPGAPATSKLDLAEIDNEPPVDESDQTSLLAPVDEAHKQKVEETPVFQFSEQEVGIADEADEKSEEGDQTSLLGPVDESEADLKKDSKPSFDFSEKDLNLTLDEEPGDSVLVADESESSVDILEVSEESSSESATSASDMIFAEESGSGEIPAIGDIEESPRGLPAVTPGTDKTVTDILGTVTEESDEEIESLDLDEVVDTGETLLQEADEGEIGADTAPAETVPVAEEFETVGIGGEETKLSESETAGVDEAIAAAIGEQVAEEEGDEEAVITEQEIEAGQTVMPAGWEIVTPSVFGNICLIAAGVLLAAAGVFCFCTMWDIQPGWTQAIVDMAKQW